MRSLTRLALLGCALSLTACGGADDPAVSTPDAPVITEHTGTLESTDETLESGEFLDSYEVLAREGQWIRIELMSSDFDPYLIVISPAGVQTDVDDSQEGNQSHSMSVLQATEGGNWTIVATSYETGETGDYTLSYEVLDANPDATTEAASGDAVLAE